MAFLHNDLPPSRAPGATRRANRAIALAIPSGKTPMVTFTRVALLLLAAALLIVPGYFAAKATESLAVGILAGDLALLIAVAGWSSVAGTARR